MSHTHLARGYPTSAISVSTDCIDVCLHIALAQPIGGIIVTDVVLRPTVTDDEADLPPPTPLLAKNLSDGAASASVDLTAPAAPRMMRFRSDQGEDRRSNLSAASREGEPLQYLSELSAMGESNAWRFTLRMDSWSAPIASNTSSFEVAAKLQVKTLSDETPDQLVLFTMNVDVDLNSKSRIVTSFCTISTILCVNDDIYYLLLKSALGDTSEQRSLTEVVTLHSSLLMYVTDIASVDFDGALTGISLLMQEFAPAFVKTVDLGTMLLAMIGQLVEFFFHGRKDDFQDCVRIADSFQLRSNLIRRCQIICGVIGDGIWNVIQSLDLKNLTTLSLTNTFSLSRLVQMGIFFLYKTDIYSLVPCFRSITSPILIAQFPSGAGVGVNAYEGALHDWHLITRIGEIKPQVDEILKNFNIDCPLLNSHRDLFTQRALRSLTDFGTEFFPKLKRVLDMLHLISEHWEDEFSPIFFKTEDKSTLPAAPSDIALFGRYQKQNRHSSGMPKARKACVEAQFSFAGLYERHKVAVEAGDTFKNNKSINDAAKLESYRSGALNYLNEFRSAAEAYDCGDSFGVITIWCGDGHKGDLPEKLNELVPASAVRMKTVQNFCCLPDGTLMIVDCSNHSIVAMPSSRNCYRVVSPKMPDTIALNRPRSIIHYPKNGRCFLITDTANHCIRMLRLNGSEERVQLSVIAGKCGTFGHLNGSGLVASFQFPSDLFMFRGKCLVCDKANHVIRGIAVNDIDASKNIVVTVIGVATMKGSIDGEVPDFASLFKNSSMSKPNNARKVAPKQPVNHVRLCNPATAVSVPDDSCFYFCEQSPPSLRKYDGLTVTTLMSGAPLRVPTAMCLYSDANGGNPSILISDQDAHCIWRFSMEAKILLPFITADDVLRTVGPCQGVSPELFTPNGVKSPIPGCVVFSDSARNEILRFMDSQLSKEATIKMDLCMKEEDSYFSPLVEALLNFSSGLSTAYVRVETAVNTLLANKHDLVSHRYSAAVENIIRTRSLLTVDNLDALKILIMSAPSVKMVRESLKVYRYFDNTTRGFSKDVYTVLVTKLSKIEFSRPYLELEDELAALADILSTQKLSNRDAQDLLCAILRSDKFMFDLTEATLCLLGVVLNRERFTLDRVIVVDLRRETLRWLNRLDKFAPLGKRIEEHALNVQHFARLWHQQFCDQDSLKTRNILTMQALGWLCRVHLDSVALYPALYQMTIMNQGKEAHTSHSVDRSLMTISSLPDILLAVSNALEISGVNEAEHRIVPILRSLFVEAAHSASLGNIIPLLLESHVEFIKKGNQNLTSENANAIAFSVLFASVHSEILFATLEKHYAVIIDRAAQQTAAEKTRHEPREPRDRRGKVRKERPESESNHLKQAPKERDPDGDIRTHIMVYEVPLWAYFLYYWSRNGDAASALLTLVSERSYLQKCLGRFSAVETIKGLVKHYSTISRLFRKNWDDVLTGVVTVDNFKRIYMNRKDLYFAWGTVDIDAKDSIMTLMEEMDGEIQNFYSSLNVLSSIVSCLAPSFSLETVLIEALKKNWANLRVCDVRFAFNATAPSILSSFAVEAPVFSEDLSSLPSDCTVFCFPPALLATMDWLHFCVSEGSFFAEFWQESCDIGDSTDIHCVAGLWQNLWESLKDSSIQFSEMEKFVSSISDKKELSCMARACWKQFKFDASYALDILDDTDSEILSAATVVNTILESVFCWKHLLCIVTTHDNLLCKLEALRRFVIPSEVLIINSLKENILELHAEYLKPMWQKRNLGGSTELYILANGLNKFLFKVSAELLDSIFDHPNIIDWLRCFTNDDDFRTALEMAMGKTEMECPLELWDSVSGRVNEQFLSRLRNIRSFLHKYLYNNDNIRTVDTVIKLFGQLNENVDPLAIAANIASCENVCTPLMSLIEVRGYSEGAVPSRLLQLYNPAHSAVWVLNIDDSAITGNTDDVLKLNYIYLISNTNDKSDSKAEGMTIQEHSYNELQDFQSTVVLSKTDNASDDLTQQLFLNQFARMGKLATILMELYESGNPNVYPRCVIKAPVSYGVDYFEDILQDWSSRLKIWKDEMLILKQRHYFVNYFVARRLQRLNQYFRDMHAQGSRADDCNDSILAECVALINPPAALDESLIASLKEKVLSELSCAADFSIAINDLAPVAGALDRVFLSIPVQSRCIFTVPEAVQQMPLSSTLFTTRAGISGLHIIECEGFADTEGCSSSSNSDPHQRDERTDELLLVLSVFAASQRAPEREEVLICDENTAMETVQNFIFLWAKAHEFGRESRMFCIIGCYLLRYDIQDALTTLVRGLESVAKCPLLITTCPSENNGLIATALSHRKKQRLMALPLETLTKFVCAFGATYANGMELFSSPYAGSGKTFAIRTRSALTAQTYVLCSINSNVEVKDVANRLRGNISHEGSSLRYNMGEKLLLHIDISNSATWSVNECLFRLCFLGILVDQDQDTFYIWNSKYTSFCIEIASDVADAIKSFLYVFPAQVITVGEESFCCGLEALMAGMGPEMFASSLYDATCDGVNKESKDAYQRLRFVHSVLVTLDNKKGSFPYSLTDCALSSSEVTNGARCYKLLIDASGLKINTSLHCLWSFVNVVFWQLNEMHHPESPLNAACMPDPLSHSIDDTENKAKIKGQIIQFIFKTAREFATRLTGVVQGRRIVQCRVSGLSRHQFNNRWQRCDYDNDGEPCFSLKNNNYFLYYRRKSNCWVIDDIIEPEGPVYSTSSSKDLCSSMWTTSPGWESSRRCISVSRAMRTHGYKGEGVVIEGCGSLRNGSCTEAEDGLYIRQIDDINGQPHYIKQGPNGKDRRHLFWETSKGCWQVSDICNDDQGAHIMCCDSRALDGGDWQSIPPDVREKSPLFELVYAEGAVMSTENSTGDASLTAEQTSELAKQGLHVELLRWKDSNHECIFFNNENHLVTFLSLNPSVLRRTMHPSLLKHLENNRIVVGDDLLSVRATPQHFQDILGGLTGVVRSTSEAGSLIDGYCMTGDSLLKMLAIVYRVRCGVPVVLMGECGCGKTMLITYLTKWLGVRLITLDIHGGTTESDIVAVFAEAAAHLNAVSSSENPSATPINATTSDVYIFLDEVNTCAHMGVIAEAICHRTINGIRVPEGIKILAALNPYRLKPLPSAEEAGVAGLNYRNNSSFPSARPSSSRKKHVGGNDPMKRLVYRVHPIPRILQDFIFDFGALDYKTEKMYIAFMIQKALPQYNPLEREFATDVISGSQFAIRGFEGDESAVSLRDVKRCLGLIVWFASYWPGGPKARTHISLFGRSLVLAVAHVYLYRLSSAQMRNQFWAKVAAIAKNFGRGVDHIQCGELTKSSFPAAVLKRVQKNFSDTFTVDAGIAMNEALTENIYVIVVCILNKIPVFVVGKPGTSKTLALQVIASNLQGAQSPHKAWRRFPAVYLFQYQCSPLSTAKSIHFQFEAAKSYQSSAEDVITVLLLDEVGLAEHSPDMPLKVLHYMLVDPPIGIVGLSNWTLDSSKMNRAICLQRPEPSVDDMMITGQNIICASDAGEVTDERDVAPPVPTLSRQTSKPGARKISPWLINLSRAFHKIYRAQAQNSHGREFFGMRDYYCLLKMFRNDLKISDDSESTEYALSVPVLLYNVCRNLGGKPSTMEYILQTFYQECFGQLTRSVVSFEFHLIKPHVPSQLKLIRDSLETWHNRHLMLLTRNSAALSLLFSCDLLDESEVTVLIGSRFQKDLAELRLIQQINEIKNAMLEGRVVILLNHDSIYESLYDVLNQRYVTRTDSVTGKIKRMLRLAIGPRSQLCPVTDGFKIIVIVEQFHAYDNLDLPLLNRFEKQVFLYDSVLSEGEKICVASLAEWTQSLLEETDLDSLDQLFAGYRAETIPSLVLYLSKNIGVDKQLINDVSSAAACELINAAKSALLRISLPIVTLRFPNLFVSNEGTSSGNKISIDLLDYLDAKYGLYGREREDFDILKRCMLSVVMTHSPVGHFTLCKSTHESSPASDTCEVKEIYLSLISSEKQITDLLADFYTCLSIGSNGCENKLLCILCDPQENDLSIIAHVKYLCVKFNLLFKKIIPVLPRSFQMSCCRHVAVVVHLPPGISGSIGRRDYTIDFQAPWTYDFIDDIRPMTKSSLNEMNDLTSKSAFALCQDGSIVDANNIICTKFQSALARCVAPAVQRSGYTSKKRVPIIQIVKFLLNFSNFVQFLKSAVLACLEIFDGAAVDNANSTPLHVKIACSDPLVAGTLKESLLSALESIIIQSLSHVFRNLDKNFNIHLLGPIVEKYAAIPADSPLGLSPGDIDTIETWLTLCSTLLDVPAIGRSCGIVFPSEVHHVDSTIVNSGLHEGSLFCKFPFSERIMVLLGGDETRRNIEKVGDDTCPGGSILPSVLINPLRAIFGSFVGGSFWSDVVLSKKSSGYCYVYDFVACRVSPHKWLSLDTHVEIFRLLTLATMKLPNAQPDLDLDPVAVQASFWANEARYFHTMSALSVAGKSEARTEQLACHLCSQLKNLSTSDGEDESAGDFVYLAQVDRALCRYYINYLRSVLVAGLNNTVWDLLAEWEKLYFSMLPDLEGLVLSLLTSLSNKSVSACHYLDSLNADVVVPFRALKTAALVISEFRLEFRTGLDAGASTCLYELISAALHENSSSIDSGLSVFMQCCLEEKKLDQYHVLCCGILRRVCTDIVETEYLFYANSPLKLVLEESLFMQLHNCVVSTLPWEVSALKLNHWLSLAKSVYCFMFNNMVQVPAMREYLVARVLEQSPISVAIAQLYLQKLQDFSELEKDEVIDDFETSDLSNLTLDSDVFRRIKSVALVRQSLDTYCDKLLTYIGGAGEAINGANICAAVAPEEDILKLLQNLDANYYILRRILCRGGAQALLSYLGGCNLPVRFSGLKTLNDISHKSTTVNPLACLAFPRTEIFDVTVAAVERVLYGQMTTSGLTDLLLSGKILSEFCMGQRISVLVAGFFTVVSEAKKSGTSLGGNVENVKLWVHEIRSSKAVADHLVHHSFNKIMNWALGGYPSFDQIIDDIHAGPWSAGRHTLTAHLSAVAAEFPRSWIGLLLTAPASFKDELVPSMPNDELLVIAAALGHVGWYTCVNGHPYVVGNCTYPMETARCSVCNARIGGNNHNTIQGTKRFDPSTRKQCKGYNLAAALHADGYDLQDGSRCNLITSSIIRYLLHLSLATSMCFGETSAISVADFMNTQGATDLKKTYRTLVSLLVKDWEHLKKVTKYGDSDLTMALHLSLNEYMCEMRVPSSKLPCIGYCIQENEKDKRENFERSFECVCRKYFMKSTSLSEIHSRTSDLSGFSQFATIRKCLGDAESAIYLHDEERMITRQLLTARLLRYREPVNFSEFTFHFGLQSENTRAYPLLAAILKAEEKLSLIRHISDVLGWHAVLFKALKPGSVARADALNMTNVDVVMRLPPEERPVAYEALEKYCVAFNRTLKLVPFLFECNANPFLSSNGEVDLSGSQRSDGRGDHMSSQTSIKFSLPSIISGEQDATGLCTIQIINALMQTHNEVLEGLMSLISSGSRNILGQKTEGDEQHVFSKKSVVVSTFRTDPSVLGRKLIYYDRQVHLMPLVYAFANQRLGCIEGSLEGFDYARIEQNLYRNLLGTAELINIHVTQFQYAGELLNTGVLRMLQERVHQEPLSVSLLDRIQHEIDTKVRLVRLLSRVEECVAFVVSTGNTGVMEVDGSMMLESYVSDVLLVPKSAWSEVSCPTITGHIQLCHLRALLQALEHWLLGDPLESVVLKYKDPFEGIASDDDLRKVAISEGCSMFMAGLFDLLTEQLCRDTWPADACLKQYVGYRDEDICDVVAYEIFPETLCLCHAYSTYKFLLTVREV